MEIVREAADKLYVGLMVTSPPPKHTHTQYANPAFTPLHHPYLLPLFPALKPNSKEFYY